MFNMIKMDVYRMFRTRSFYVIGIIFMVMIVATSAVVKVMSEDENMSQIMEQAQDVGDSSTNIGMSVSITPNEDGKVSIVDDLYGNTSGKLLALFLVIFTVLYASADYTSGYIKNIAGQVKSRVMMVASKAVCLLLYTILFFGGYVVVQIVSDRLILGYFNLGKAGELFSYLGIELLLHYALVLLVMSLTIIIRNNLISMIISVCLCMNVFSLIYSGIDWLVRKMGINDVSVFKYSLTGNISAYLPTGTADDRIRCIAVAAVFGIVCLAAGSAVFRKRDVV